MRHLRPLTDFFPFAIRYGLERGIRHVELNKALTKEIAVNELALAQCEIFLMREKRKKPSGDMLKTKPQSTKETKEEVKETSKNEKPAKRQRAFGARNSKEQESGRLDPDLFKLDQKLPFAKDKKTKPIEQVENFITDRIEETELLDESFTQDERPTEEIKKEANIQQEDISSNDSSVGGRNDGSNVDNNRTDTSPDNQVEETPTSVSSFSDLGELIPGNEPQKDTT